MVLINFSSVKEDWIRDPFTAKDSLARFKRFKRKIRKFWAPRVLFYTKGPRNLSLKTFFSQKRANKSGLKIKPENDWVLGSGSGTSLYTQFTGY